MNTRACPYCSKPMIPGTLCAEWCHGLSFRPHSVTPQDEHSPRDFETFYVCKSLFRRNLHLTQETVEKLFGEGYQLTKRKDLSYPGQFACNERLTVVGPKREQANVSILGPVRKADQVELSATDARNLGIDAPVRESGDVKGSGACKLIGPKGEVELSEGVIIAKRHLHVREEDAAAMGIKDKEIIRVACGGEGRKLIFDDVVVRVNVGGATTMHIDTDEAQAAGNPTVGEIYR